MEGSFEQKKFLLTGATSGIGLFLAESLLDSNAEMFFVGRNTTVLSELERKAHNGPARGFQVDLCDESMIEQLARELPALDGLILNAGIVDYTPVKMISYAKMRKVFSINFEANVLLIQKLLKQKKISQGASVIFIGSVSALKGVPGTALYAASKAALTSFAKVLAGELARQKIRVNVISPGIVNTDSEKKELLQTTASIAAMEEKYPLGLGIPGDINDIVHFLLSHKSRWITGSNIVVDGGYTIQ